MRGSIAGAAIFVVLLAAAPAQAGQRFAAPAGSGAECTQAAPCSLAEAVSGAHAGDEVIVTGGTYTVGAALALPSVTNVQVHGDTGGPMPRIVASLPSWVMEMYEPGDSISYLEIENDADSGAGIYCTDGRIDRIRARVVGGGGIGVYAFPDCNSVRNSLLLTEGTGSAALRASSYSGEFKLPARNVTAISSGIGSSGAVAEYLGAAAGSTTLELENSIVQGGGQDLKPVGNMHGAGVIAATHSNYDSANPGSEGKVVDGGGNQTAAPLFVGAENGDYREAAGSPTIDGGLAGELGPLDLAGIPRVQGSAPDIGAYEFVPVAVPPGGVRTIKVKPKKFRARKSGGSVAAGIGKSKPPVGAEVIYTMSGAAQVEFSVSRRVTGREAGKRCGPKTGANAGHKKCFFFKPLKGLFTQAALAGKNSFVFTGRIGGRTLPPGHYALTAFAGHLVSAQFTIVG